MIKCPNCGSAAQVKKLKTEPTYSADIVIVHTLCQCGCGKTFWHYKSFNEFLQTVKEGYTNAKIL